MTCRAVRNAFAFVVVCGLAMFAARGAVAGPPLISDDPNTIGRGRVEALLAIRGGADLRTNSVAVPVVDLTLGLAEGLDFVVVGEPVFLADSLVDPSEGWSTSASIEGGLKWRPLAKDHLTASFTPVIGVNVLSAEQFFVRLPVQVEARFGRFALGVDGGYQFVRHSIDGWNASIYASWQATPKLALMTELWSLRASAIGSADFGAGAGFEMNLVHGLSLLGMGGGGIASHRDDRINWIAYFGVKWAFRAFGGPNENAGSVASGATLRALNPAVADARKS